jgi:ABC-2 type transport system ATP-binding protein
MFRGLYAKGLSVEELLQLCALEKLEKRDNRKLSGGQMQRLLLAIALVNDPQLLFLDEPTTGLDPQARRNFWELVQSIKARNKTIILTTHYMEEAELLCDEIAIMDRGRIIAQGSPRRLLREHFAEVLLELPRQEFPDAARQLPLRLIEASDRVEITTDDLDGTLRVLMDARVPLTDLRIRPPNLEDLFLELTGKELRA